MKRKILSLALVGLGLCFSSGCSTIVNGRRQTLIIESNPLGAAFEVDGVTGVTPGTASVERRRSSHKVTVTKPGYQPSQQIIAREVNPWVLGNVLLVYGFIPGVLIDFISGAAYELRTDQVQVNLQPEDSSPPQQISAKQSQLPQSVATTD